MFSSVNLPGANTQTGVQPSAANQAVAETPQSMAAAGVPFHLAYWYHLIGRHLTRLTDWDRDLIKEVQLRLALSHS
jgi:hypothetical protein